MTDKFSSQKESLKTQLGKFNTIPKPCKPVGIVLKYPVFSDLTPDQLNYYLYWKSTLGTPNFKIAAYGYLWLFIAEIINGSDRNDASKKLNMLCSAGNSDGRQNYSELFTLATEFSLLFDTPMPQYMEWMGNVDPAFLSRAFASPVSDIPAVLISSYVPLPINKDETLVDRICNLLRTYDNLLKKKTDHGLRDTFMRPVKSCILPFKEYAYLGEKIPLEVITWRSKGDMVSRLFKLAYSICSGDGAIKSEYGLPFVNELVEEYKNTDPIPGPFPDPFSKPDGVLVRQLGTKPTDLGPSCFFDSFAKQTSAHKNTLGELFTFSQIQPESKNAHFVTSDCEHPSFIDLSLEQFEYYVHWKQSFLRGIALDTDNGYVNLYLSELINIDTQFTPLRLQRLLNTYGKDGSGLISSVLMDYELLNGRRFSDPRIYLDRYVVNSWIEEFIKGTNKAPLNPTLLGIMRTGGMNIRYISEDIPLQPMSQALQEVFNTVCSDMSAEEVFNARSVVTWKSLFADIDFLRGHKEVKVKYTDYLQSAKFVKFIDKSIRLMSALLSKNRSNDNSRVGNLSLLGTDCTRIFKNIASKWSEETQEKPQDKIVLDRDAISVAQSDLAAVTEMMCVPDNEPEDIVENPLPEIKKETDSQKDPWDALRDILEPTEIEYLNILLQPPGSSKGKAGIARTKIEDSINGKSLDCIGDTIIENSRLVNEYLNEIKKMIL